MRPTSAIAVACLISLLIAADKPAGNKSANEKPAGDDKAQVNLPPLDALKKLIPAKVAGHQADRQALQEPRKDDEGISFEVLYGYDENLTVHRATLWIRVSNRHPDGGFHLSGLHRDAEERTFAKDGRRLKRTKVKGHLAFIDQPDQSGHSKIWVYPHGRVEIGIWLHPDSDEALLRAASELPLEAIAKLVAKNDPKR